MRRIEVNQVTKRFPRRTGGSRLLRHIVQGWLSREEDEEASFVALRNVSFSIDDGESVAVIGHNGAGKSTLLNLITGVAPPDTGSVTITGRIASLLELGAGFHPDLTGHENLILNAALIGLTPRQVQKYYFSIVEFSGIGEFMNQPVRTYSSGMTMRLAFSIVIHGNPDILIIDEVLGVGDQAFQAKCFEKILDFQRQGKTIVCVSHAADSLMKLCQRAIWLDHGELLMDGPIKSVVAAYSGRALPEQLTSEQS